MTNVITVDDGETIIQLAETGPQGPSGPAGPQGPTGAPGSGGDLSFEMDFVSQTTVTVHHNLGKYPAVVVIDSAGDLCEGFVDHQSVNTLVVTFSATFSGSVICN